VNKAGWPTAIVWLDGWPDIVGETEQFKPQPATCRITGKRVNNGSNNDRRITRSPAQSLGSTLQKTANQYFNVDVNNPF